MAGFLFVDDPAARKPRVLDASGAANRDLMRNSTQIAGAAAEFFESVPGAWKLADRPHGLRIVDSSEDENPITGNTSRFLPHAIL
jgi:hypothetical protein